MFVNNALYELCKLSDAIEGEDTFHQRRVCVIAFEIARELNFDYFGLDLIVKSALIHDIGLLSDTSKVETFRQIAYGDFDSLNRHATIGGRIARFLNLHLDVTLAIQLHHAPKDRNSSVLGSILFLADNVELAFRRLTNPYAFSDAMDFLNKRKTLFDSNMFAAFGRVAKRECFWFSLLEEHVDDRVREIINSLPKQEASDKFKTALTYLLSYMSDNISPYFNKYTLYSKNIAVSLAYMLGLDSKLVHSASLLSHVGNLLLPYDVFNLPDIDDETYNLVKTHTYEGYKILKRMGFEKEAELVLLHHENNLKKGYPCKVKPKGETSVLAVATIIAAMMQSRFYRGAKSDEEIKKVIEHFKNIGLFDKEVLDVALKIDLNKVKRTEDEYYNATKKLFL